MISLTYILSGIGLALTGWAFMQGWLTAFTQALCWSVVFFVASAAASSAYLTASEVFPMQMRALAISIFYVVAGTILVPRLWEEPLGPMLKIFPILVFNLFLHHLLVFCQQAFPIRLFEESPQEKLSHVVPPNLIRIRIQEPPL